MPSKIENKQKAPAKIKFVVILGYVLIVAVMLLGLFAVYFNLVDYSAKKLDRAEMSELLIVSNTLSMLYEIESDQNLVNAENAALYLSKFDSITPKIAVNLTDLKNLTQDSSRIMKLDTIQLLVESKRENLQEIAVLLDSISRAPRIIVDQQSTYVPSKLNKEIVEYLEKNQLSKPADNLNDTSVVMGDRKGFLDRVRNVFVARTDSMLVIEKTTILPEDNLKLIVDTIVNKVRYSETLDLNRKRHFQRIYIARQESMNSTNQLLTSRINDLLKGIEMEEMENTINMLKEKEETLSNSKFAMFVVSCLAVAIAFVFAILLLVDVNRSSRYRKQLEHSNQRISNLLAAREKLMLTISHDIKAPMSSIIGFIELMDTQGNEKNETYLSNMRNSGEHILELASALLDHHKLEQGSWQLKETTFNLHSLVNNATSGFEPIALWKGLSYTVENHLPEHLTIKGDLYMLRQIMNNLISNAIKYTPVGSVKVNVNLLEGDSNRLSMTITDTGNGIDEADQQRIFEEFNQLSNSAGVEGSGLGLSIVKGFVEALDGVIKLNSQRGMGSEFIIEIPVQIQDDDLLTHDGEKVNITEHDLQGISVLLVDDDPVQLTMTSEMLNKMKVDCVAESNPYNVFSLLQTTTFDIIFMDIQMPGINGLELIEKIRRDGNLQMQQIPVIGLSARAEMSDELVKNVGFNFFLPKPFSAEMLYNTIGNFVHGRSSAIEGVVTQASVKSKPKGPMALIEFVSDDKDASTAILQSFIQETSDCRAKLESAFFRDENTLAMTLAHKILPLFKLIGDTALVDLMVRLEKNQSLSKEEKQDVLNGIQKYLEEAKLLKRSYA